MFDGPPPPEPDDEDIFAEISGELTPLQQKLRELSPLAMGATTKSLTVVSAIFAWFLTPPIGRVASLGAVVAGGYGGTRLSKNLRAQRKEVVPAVIADMVREGGFKSLDPTEVAQLADKYGVEAVEFEAQLSSVYARYLRQLLGDADEIGTKAISELSALRRGIGLKWSTTQQVHVSEATDYLDGEKPASVDELPPEMAALLWLTSGLFQTSKGRVDAAELREVLALSEIDATGVISGISAPIYQNAVTAAVGKYNRTQTPDVLQRVREALCLTEQAAQAVHAQIYDAQLQVLLPEEEDSKLTEESMALLGELEGMLQVRSASGRLLSRTLPLFRETCKAKLSEAYGAAGSASPVGVWGGLAVRQQELVLGTEATKAVVAEESRKLVAGKMSAAAAAQARGEGVAMEEALRIVQYGDFLGLMAELAGLEPETMSATEIREAYLGSLSLPNEAEQPALEIAAAAATSATEELATGAALLNAILALIDPALASARATYNQKLEGIVEEAAFDSAATATLDDLVSTLGLPKALAQQLGIKAYYAWLTDLSEKGDRIGLEQASAVRECLRLGPAAVAELHANTGVDELVLSACCEQLMEGMEGDCLTAAAEQQISYLDRQLAARPGIGAAVLSAVLA